MTEWKTTDMLDWSNTMHEIMMVYEVTEGTRFSVSLPLQIQLKGANVLTCLCSAC